MKDQVARKTADQACDAIHEINIYLNRIKKNAAKPIKEAAIGDYVNYCGEPHRVGHLTVCEIPYADTGTTDIVRKFWLISPEGEEKQYTSRETKKPKPGGRRKK